MNTPFQLIFVRHGESLRNVAKSNSSPFYKTEVDRAPVYGIPDFRIPLTERGHEQSRQVGTFLRDTFDLPDVIFHSGFTRTIETLDEILNCIPIEERSKIAVIHSPHLIERNAGLYTRHDRERGAGSISMASRTLEDSRWILRAPAWRRKYL